MTQHAVDTQSEFTPHSSETEWGSEMSAMDTMATKNSSKSDFSESPTCSDCEELYESFYSVSEANESFTSEGMGRNTDGDDMSGIGSFSERMDYSKLTAALGPLYEP